MNPPEVHLKTGRSEVCPEEVRWRAFPLGEANVPVFLKPGRGLLEYGIKTIIDRLDVENAPRYQPDDTATFCNIYAYDVCCLAGVYLPRVWWTEHSVNKWKMGEEIIPQYGETVLEMTANALLTWLIKFGPLFGWEQTSDLTTLQQSVNNGSLGLIAAQGNPPVHGHISIVMPERDKDIAWWTKGEVEIPLQSYAGRENVKFGGALAKTWWYSASFSNYGYWIWRPQNPIQFDPHKLKLSPP
jgi:hypothetical protein